MRKYLKRQEIFVIFGCACCVFIPDSYIYNNVQNIYIYICVCVFVFVKINNKDIRTAPWAAVFIVNFDYIIYYINILACYIVIYISIYLYKTSYRNNVQILPQIQR